MSVRVLVETLKFRSVRFRDSEARKLELETTWSGVRDIKIPIGLAGVSTWDTRFHCTPPFAPAACTLNDAKNAA